MVAVVVSRVEAVEAGAAGGAVVVGIRGGGVLASGVDGVVMEVGAVEGTVVVWGRGDEVPSCLQG